MRVGKSTSLVAVAALLVVASGCGARWSGTQRESVLARNRAGGSSGAVAAGPRSGTAAGAAAGTASGATASGDAAGGPADVATGGAAGPTDGSGPAAAASLPCAAHSDAPGVTDDTITVGNISTLSGPIPGLGASAVGATRAYIAYLNANGGVCGRKVELKTADDGDDNGAFRSAVNGMGPNVLGLVGNDAGGDAGGADVVESQKIPVVATAFNASFQQVSTVFDVNPPFPDKSNSIAKYKWLHDNGANKVALVYIAADAARHQMDDTERPLMEAAGIQVVSEQALPLSTLNYDSAARTVANSGADYMMFLGGYEENSGMAESMAGTGYHLKFAEYYTTYGTNFIDQAGSAAEGAISWSFALPVEDGGRNPEQATFLQWLSQTSPDVTADVFADEAWAASKAFFTALTQLPGPITRDALIAQLHTFTSYDADGFYGKIDLGDKVNFGCRIAMQVVNGKWQRLVPSDGFLC